MHVRYFHNKILLLNQYNYKQRLNIIFNKITQFDKLWVFLP